MLSTVRMHSNSTNTSSVFATSLNFCRACFIALYSEQTEDQTVEWPVPCVAAGQWQD